MIGQAGVVKGRAFVMRRVGRDRCVVLGRRVGHGMGWMMVNVLHRW